ncbi:hypothetical protein C8Q80DRAFT_320775 [Daedaleopsis nitida]|nr:hypothetical protein C8Q80DRAFT_320775 [Daedaleopsis nitida]
MSDAKATDDDTVQITSVFEKSDNLQLGEHQLEFFRRTTGIVDKAAIKAHIVAVQQEACALKPYPCIVNFRFADFRLQRVQPRYTRLLELGRSRRNPTLIDVGCCMGVDIRNLLILDGYPADGG